MEAFVEESTVTKGSGFGVLFILAALVTAVLGIGAQTVLHEMHLNKALGSLNAGFELAREEAMRRGKPVHISGLGQDLGENQWQRGWVVWVDENLNGRRDVQEELHSESLVPEEATLVNLSHTPDFRYQPSGQIRSTGVLKLCDGRSGHQRGHRISVSAIGNLVVTDTLCT